MAIVTLPATFLDYSIAVSVCPTRTTRVISGLSDSAIGNTSRSASWIRFAELAGDYEVLNSSHAEGTTPPRETQGLATTSLTRRLAGTQKVEDGAEAVEKAMIHKLAEMFVVSEGDIEAAQLYPILGLLSTNSLRDLAKSHC
ncbi:hypothetical protein F5X97DRAFT_324994 [Nemania serpens]|nr:hypothetical protein F5X97DRAFT_324994 [Nemania serpens]